MFHALANDKIATGAFEFRHELVDIETLNRRAFSGELELTAVSIHAYAHLTDKYVLCPCGASMGDKYGPMVVATKQYTIDQLRPLTIAVPVVIKRLAVSPIRVTCNAFTWDQKPVGHGDKEFALADGSFSGTANSGWTFRPTADGAIGTTSGLAVEVRDGNGTLVALLDVGADFVPGTELAIAEGISVSFGAGEVAASEGDAFAVELAGDPDSAGVLVAFGLNALIAYPLFTALSTAKSESLAFGLALTGLLVNALYTSVGTVVKAELFPANVRALGVALPYALATATFGGTAEYVALWFKQAGFEHGFYLYLSAMSAMAFAVALFMRDTKHKSLIAEL